MMGKLENRVSMSRSRASRDISSMGENRRTYQQTCVSPTADAIKKGQSKAEIIGGARPRRHSQFQRQM
jgi:hypothetical protein